MRKCGTGTELGGWKFSRRMDETCGANSRLVNHHQPVLHVVVLVNDTFEPLARVQGGCRLASQPRSAVASHRLDADCEYRTIEPVDGALVDRLRAEPSYVFGALLGLASRRAPSTRST